MTRRLSDWSKPGEKPPMVGVWETDLFSGVDPVFQGWDGQCYGLPASTPTRAAFELQHCRIRIYRSTVCFRGLADKPE